MTMPVGERHLAFTCTPDHATYANVRRTTEFTVSWPPADAVLLTSLTAAPRSEDGEKFSLSVVPTRPASTVAGGSGRYSTSLVSLSAQYPDVHCAP